MKIYVNLEKYTSIISCCLGIIHMVKYNIGNRKYLRVMLGTIWGEKQNDDKVLY